MPKRMSMKQFDVALQTAGHIYFTAECGCIVLCMYDIDEVVNDAKDDILRHTLKGRTLKRAAKGQLPPWNCPQHADEPRTASRD